nr:hypothetical protein BgiMline_006473 [Biomphalaria glabrata]
MVTSHFLHKQSAHCKPFRHVCVVVLGYIAAELKTTTKMLTRCTRVHSLAPLLWWHAVSPHPPYAMHPPYLINMNETTEMEQQAWGVFNLKAP